MSRTKSVGRASKHVAGVLAQAQSNDSAIPSSVCKLIEQGRYGQACDALRALPRSPLVQQTLAVCSMRAGLLPQAISILRGMCLNPGTTVIRLEADDTLRINYATAILLAGMPSGALDILGDLKDRQAPAAVALKDAIANWIKSLSFWRRLDWTINRVDPHQAVVPLEFAPGVIPFALPRSQITRPDPVDPNGPNKTSPRLAA